MTGLVTDGVGFKIVVDVVEDVVDVVGVVGAGAVVDGGVGNGTVGADSPPLEQAASTSKLMAALRAA